MHTLPGLSVQEFTFGFSLVYNVGITYEFLYRKI